MIAIPPPQPGVRPRWRDRSRRIPHQITIPATAYYYAVGLITGAAAAASAVLLIR